MWQSTLLLLLSTRLISAQSSDLEVCQQDPDVLTAQFPTQYIDIPVDHFKNDSRYGPHSNATFKNRWWYNDKYYTPGGPVIVLNAGESNGVYELSLLDVGQPGTLAKATGGIAVVLEHRYYGDSFPVTRANRSEPLTLEDYRFLTVQQALADQAFFARNVRFPGHSDVDLTAANTPYFAIGCSYPGAVTAFERIQYPDVYWGAIASSAVTVPKVDYWEWWDTIRQDSPPACVAPVQKIINVADTILLGENQTQIEQLKHVFDQDPALNNTEFAALLKFDYDPYLRMWVPCRDQSSPQFCDIMGNTTLQFPQLAAQEGEVREIISNGGWANESDTLTASFLNFVGYTTHLVPATSSTQQDSSSTSHVVKRAETNTPQRAFSYSYQMCTELGYFIGAGGPQRPLPIISSLVTLDYLLEQCAQRFDLLTPPLHTDDVSRYGGFNVSYERLMLVGGEKDTWRTVTPLISSPTGSSGTPDEPRFVIEGGAHCWDQLGLRQNETSPGFPPEAVQEAQRLQVETIQRWVEEWKSAKQGQS
ncbi:hypothetical protein PRZ48_013129 [Zasmidium cellare]|uniref:Uncharacterized protein n=1 Tax=Zasmidium cellare TaxID=395010 RepID=A0ABR0E3R0_ZASCE|nr:hypothetical protein PRZ48_013129 [Zasmidium cellare]